MRSTWNRMTLKTVLLHLPISLKRMVIFMKFLGLYLKTVVGIVATVGDFGFVVMVNGANLGEECEVQITRVLSTMAFGRILEGTDKVVEENIQKLKNGGKVNLGGKPSRNRYTEQVDRRNKR